MAAGAEDRAGWLWYRGEVAQQGLPAKRAEGGASGAWVSWALGEEGQ